MRKCLTGPLWQARIANSNPQCALVVCLLDIIGAHVVYLLLLCVKVQLSILNAYINMQYIQIVVQYWQY